MRGINIGLSLLEKRLIIFSLPGILTLTLLNFFLFISPHSKTQQNQSLQNNVSSIEGSVEQYGLLSYSGFAEQVDDCRWEVMACDQQFKDNKTLACGLGRSRLIDALLTRDDSPCKGRDKAYVEQQAELACTRECPPPTATPRPPTPTTRPTDAPTSTPVPTLTATPTITPEATPTTQPAPTGDSTQDRLSFVFEISLEGIGKDPANNSTPVTAVRSGEVGVLNSSGQTVSTHPVQFTYSADTGTYKGTLQLDSQSSPLEFKARIENTLFKEIPDTITIQPGKREYPLSPIGLVSGDLNKDNSLDIQDYNLILACFRNEGICTADIRKVSDLNDNNNLYADDLNILLKGFYTPRGDFRFL